MLNSFFRPRFAEILPKNIICDLVRERTRRETAPHHYDNALGHIFFVSKTLFPPFFKEEAHPGGERSVEIYFSIYSC